MESGLARLALLAALMAANYVVVVRLSGVVAPVAVRALGLARRYSLGDATSVVRLGLAGITQLGLAGVLVAVTGVSLRELFVTDFHVVLLIYGALLGVAEMAATTFVGHVAIRTAMAVGGDRVPRRMDDWLTIARGGWMRQYLRTAEISPIPVALALTVLYVAVEETIFRGIAITYLSPGGTALAVAGSIALFAAVQVPFMPSWQAAMFPFLSALLIGLVHGLLFVAVPNVAPLIVAHLVFFLIAVL